MGRCVGRCGGELGRGDINLLFLIKITRLTHCRISYLWVLPDLNFMMVLPKAAPE